LCHGRAPSAQANRATGVWQKSPRKVDLGYLTTCQAPRDRAPWLVRTPPPIHDRPSSRHPIDEMGHGLDASSKRRIR
jgi:hypothetical protein